MIIRNSIHCRLWLPVLIIAAVSLVGLAGCGEDAPYGSTITVEPIEAYTPPISSIPGGQNAPKYVTYRVTVSDPAGLPMNGVEVEIHGNFSSGSGISMNGAVGDAPVILTSKTSMYAHGYRDFTVSSPTLSYLSTPLSAPTAVNGTPQAGAGLLSNGTYNIAITSIDAANRETTPSVPITAILSDGTSTQGIAVNWTTVSGAAAYNVYGNNGAGGILRLASRVTGTSYVYGSIAGGVGVPTANSATTAANTVNGTITVSTGPAYVTKDISF